MTLRQRLLMWYGGVLLVTGSVLVLSVYFVVAHKINKEFIQFLTDEYFEGVEIVNAQLEFPVALNRAVTTETKGDKYFPLVYRLHDTEEDRDLIVMANDNDWVADLPPFIIPAEDAELSVLFMGRKSEEIHFLTGWPDRDLHPNLVLSVGLSHRKVHQRLASLRYNLVLGFLFATLLATVGGHVIASRGLKPIHQVVRSLERVQAGNLSYRLTDPETKDEISRIVTSVNSMLDRIEQAFQQLEDFTADAAHEFRTPLTAVRCRLDVALERTRDGDEYREAIGDSLERLTELDMLVDNLLLLASLDAKPDSHKRGQVDLTELLTDITEFFEIAAEQNGIKLSLKCNDENIVTGNSTLLRRLFSNLIENAIRHSPAGGKVQIATIRKPTGCEISVADTGGGIGPGDISKIFQRFYRADSARTWGTEGTGLGLSICKKITEVHGGQIKATSQAGKGTTFTVLLPH